MAEYYDVVTLRCRLKAADRELELFRSGEKYVQMSRLHQEDCRNYERRIQKMQEELSRAHSETVTIREQWFEIFEDLEKEYAKKVSLLLAALKKLEERSLRAERQRDEALEKNTDLRRQLYQTAAALEEEQGKTLKLRAQLNRDYENSSLPSSRSRRHKKIPNSRERSGRKPGGQPGHKGHGRKKQAPTQPPILLPPPGEALADPDFRKTSKTIVKQLIGIRLVMDVKEYHADVYYNSKTGERIHAAFPAGVVNDVNYDSSIKAFLFLLNQDCCVSIDKSRKFLKDLTGGKLSLSKGMVNGLSREFSQRCQAELKKAYADMLMAPVMHTDCTNARVNGKNAYVYVCAVPSGEALYFARNRKGHEGVKGTVTEDYQGILVHDHEPCFYSYGSGHQECLAHVLRYLKGSMENEPGRSWNRQMRELLQEMIHYANTVFGQGAPDSHKVMDYERRCREILEQARKEYEDIPPEPYYRDGYNLYRRMEKYMENHLLFLKEPGVPSTNNEAERRLRAYKRKQAQAVTFRSFESLDQLCQCMSMLVMMREKEGQNIFQKVCGIFG